MRLVHLYLIGYAILVLGALVALRNGGILQRVAGAWIAIAVMVAVGLGVMLAATTAKRTVTSE